LITLEGPLAWGVRRLASLTDGRFDRRGGQGRICYIVTTELALLSECCLKFVEILAHHVPYVHDDRVKPIQDLLVVCAFMVLDLGRP